MRRVKVPVQTLYKSSEDELRLTDSKCCPLCKMKHTEAKGDKLKEK